MTKLLHNPQQLIESCKTIIKDNAGDSTSVFVVEIDGQLCLLKRYNINGFSQRIKTLLRGSRAKVAHKFSEKLLALNIPTAQVLAVKYSRVAPSYVLYEHLDAECCAKLFFQSKNEEWQNIVERILAITSQLGEARLSHNDYHCGNFLIAENHPILIDLDHMKQHWFGFTARRAHKKDIEHFEGYLGDKPEAKEIYSRLSSMSFA